LGISCCWRTLRRGGGGGGVLKPADGEVNEVAAEFLTTDSGGGGGGGGGADVADEGASLLVDTDKEDRRLCRGSAVLATSAS